MKKIKKTICLLLLSGSLFTIILNITWLGKSIIKNFDDGFTNIYEGRKFTSDFRSSNLMIDASLRLIPPNSNIFFWTPSQSSIDIAIESKVWKLNYALDPVTVYYKDKANMIKSDFIICEIHSLPFLKIHLLQAKNIYLSPFSLIHKNSEIVILKRESAPCLQY